MSDTMSARRACELIVALVEWDEHGPVRPVSPYRWKTIARMAADLARAGMALPLPPKSPKVARRPA